MCEGGETAKMKRDGPSKLDRRLSDTHTSSTQVLCVHSPLGRATPSCAKGRAQSGQTMLIVWERDLVLEPR